MKEQDKTSEKELNKIEISNLPNKEFKIMIIKMFTKLGRKMDEHSENFNKHLEELKNKQTEMNDTITEMKNTLEGIDSRITEAEERISDLEDRMVKLTAVGQNKTKKQKTKNK